MIPGYRFISPIKTPSRCPHMSKPWPLICSPRFSAWLINKCPCNFAQLVSHSSHWLNGEEKHIPFWCTSEGTQTPHQVVLIIASRPYQAVYQCPQSLGPTAAGLCTPDKCCCHPHPLHLRPPPSSSHCFGLPLSCPPFRLSFITYTSTLLPRPPPPPHSPCLPSPLVSPRNSVPYSSAPVIRSWRPPAGVNGGENRLWVSGCISSLRCLSSSNEDGHCQTPTSRCARHTWGHNEQCV